MGAFFHSFLDVAHLHIAGPAASLNWQPTYLSLLHSHTDWRSVSDTTLHQIITTTITVLPSASEFPIFLLSSVKFQFPAAVATVMINQVHGYLCPILLPPTHFHVCNNGFTVVWMDPVIFIWEESGTWAETMTRHWFMFLPLLLLFIQWQIIKKKRLSN